MSIQRISVGAGGVQGNGASATNKAAFSADDRYVVFESGASNLVAGDTNGVRDIFLLDRSTGLISRVSTSSAGAQAGSESFDATISADGKYVFYRTFANELSGQGSTPTLIRKEIATGQIDVGPTTHSGDANDILISASADGRYVLYTQPGGNGGPIARYDYLTGETVLANTTPSGQQLGFLSTNAPSISADGRFALFYSDGAFVAGDQATYDTFIKDLNTGEIIRASSASGSPTTGGNSDSHDGYISGDGKYAVFISYASNLVPGDTNGINDVYRVDLSTREVVLVSSRADGSIATGPDAGPIASSSDNGRYVVFNSRQTNLVDDDTNGFEDIFVKDVDTGRITRVSVATDGTQGNGHSHTPSISHDGRFVTFTSDATNLVGGDTNGTSDVFLVDLAESGFWQGAEKVGGNVQVNTLSAGDQLHTDTVALADDRFIVTWTDAAVGMMKGQFFSANGIKEGSEFDITPNSYGYNHSSLKLANGDVLFYSTSAPAFGKIISAAGSIRSDVIASPESIDGYIYATALPNGGFIISYSAHGFVDIGVQAYDALGLKVGNPFFVASGTYNEFVNKEVIAFSDGSYGLLYDQNSTGLILQRFDATGNAVGSATLVSASTADIGYHSQIDTVLLPNGQAFAAWSQGGLIQGRFFDSHGTPLGSDVSLSPSSPSGQNWPHVSVTTEGHIAIAWTVGGTLYAKILASDGSAISQATVLTTSVSIGWAVYPTALPNGGVLYTWRGLDGNGEGAEARMIDSNGAIVSDELLLNTATIGNQYGEQAAVNSQGVVLATFYDGNGTDGSGFGVFTQVLNLNGTTTPPVCFLAGTMIRTPSGETAVENLEIGDMITTADGRALPVRFIGRQTIVSRFADPLTAHPVCISAGALGQSLPARDLYTSPGHAMLLDGVLVIAGALVNGTSVYRMARLPERFTYFHIELDEHVVIFAEGAATETFCDNVPREIFDNAAEHKALYPDARPTVQLDLPTVKSPRQLPASFRRHLAIRAIAIGKDTGTEVAA